MKTLFICLIVGLIVGIQLLALHAIDKRIDALQTDIRWRFMETQVMLVNNNLDIGLNQEAILGINKNLANIGIFRHVKPRFKGTLVEGQ